MDACCAAALAQIGHRGPQDTEMYNPEKVGTTRYRYRGSVIATPWPVEDEGPIAA